MTLSHCYLTYNHHTVFDDFHFHLELGQWTCILGTSGVGKSSLLKILAGLIQPDKAKIDSDRPVSYLPQKDCLLPWLSVWENIFLGTRLRGEKTEKISQAEYLLEHFGLKKVIHLKPQALSGGTRQKVTLVRTLLEDHPVILMDEPFASLDIATRMEIHDQMNAVLKDKTVLLVTHDPLDAARLADRVYLMKGEPAQLTEIASPQLPKPRLLQSTQMIEYYGHLLQELCV